MTLILNNKLFLKKILITDLRSIIWLLFSFLVSSNDYVGRQTKHPIKYQTTKNQTTNLFFRSLNRISDLRSKILTFGKTQINLLFRSLNRISDLWSKILTFGKTQINLFFRSLNRIFASGKKVFANWKLQIVS